MSAEAAPRPTVRVVANDALQRTELWRGDELVAWVRYGQHLAAYRVWWARVLGPDGAA